MAIKSIQLFNFRNYQARLFGLDPNLTLVTGPNASGKTNLIESLFVAATTRSWRASDRHLISHSQPSYRLLAKLTKDVLVVSFQTAPRLKRLSVNGKTTKPERFLGRLRVVLFEPQSLELLTGSPHDRRDWINRALALTSSSYWQDLTSYRRVLVQRNSLLRQGRRASIESQVFAWDVPMVELANRLYTARQKFVEFINHDLSTLYAKVAGQILPTSLHYQTQIDRENYASDLMTKLATNLTADIGYGATSVGPHRDDLVILFKGRPISQIGSRGEHRSVVLALKLLELKWQQASKGELALLLDDVFSELDKRRRQFLLDQVGAVQTVITATDKAGVGAYLPKSHSVIRLPKQNL